MKKIRSLVVISLMVMLLLAATSFAAKSDKIVVGSSIQPLLNPWVVSNVEFQKHVANALGIELVFADTQNKEEKQIQDIERLCARDVNGILITAQTQAVGPRIVKICEKYKIPLANYDRYVDVDIKKSKIITSQILGDEEIAGYYCMKSLLEAGSRKIVLINLTKGTSSAESRYLGMKRALAEYPDAKLIGEQWIQITREEAVSVMENYLAKFSPGEIDGVYTTASVIGMGAMEAVKKANRLSQIKIATHDIMPDVVQAIQKGELLYAIGGTEYTGGFALIQLYDKLKGKSVDKEQIIFNQIGVSTKNVDNWIKYWINQPPFSAEEIRQLSKAYNPKANLKGTLESLTIIPKMK